MLKMKTEPYILVIDDENYICESCDRIFSNAGYRVDTNISASKGFRQALTNPYDAIILDINLVESDGMKLLYGIRKKKPDVPVVIITGYPSEDSRRMSSTMGVIDYITKPFEPAELLEPVQRVVTGESESREKEIDLISEEIREPGYHFYQSAWFYPMGNGVTRVGGYLPNLLNTTVKSIKLPVLGSRTYRGLPLAEVTLDNGTKQIIPSPISGKIRMINDSLSDYFYNLEKNLHRKNWIAIMEPDHLEEDIKSSEARTILVFAGNSSEENEFFKRISCKGYHTKMTNDIDELLRILKSESIQVVVMDAKDFDDPGPGYVRKINQKFPGIKTIVLNEPNMKMERKYRRNNIFYYGVNPISNNEMVDLLHCAFTDDSEKIRLRNPHVSSFLPNTISKISITNGYGKKVILFAYDEILLHEGGLGYLLTKELHDTAFPLTIHHTRFHKSIDEISEIQKIAMEKEKNDRVIILQTRDLNAIPGCISKEVEQYANPNSALNLLINFHIQPVPGKASNFDFDANTTIALKNIIIHELVSD